MKLDDDAEAAVEARVARAPRRQPGSARRRRDRPRARGRPRRLPARADREALRSTSAGSRSCSTAPTAPPTRRPRPIFRRFGAEVEVIAADPDGRNINEGCGSTHPEALAARVLELGAEIGFAFDGDGDRVRRGRRRRHGPRRRRADRADRRPPRRQRRARRRGRGHRDDQLRLPQRDGGGRHRGRHDRRRRPHVSAELALRGWTLGGEQSGHLIWTDFAPTGDGIAAALLTLRALGGTPLAEARPIERLPQVLENVRVADRDAIAGADGLWAAVERENAALEGRGRVLVSALRHRAAAESDGRGARASPNARRSAVGWSRSSNPNSARRRRIRRYPESSSHVWNRRIRRRASVPRPADRRAREARVPRLRLGRHLAARGRSDRHRAGCRQPREPARRGRPRGDRPLTEDGGIGRRGRASGATIGLGHTRWATHGRVTEENAHPHGDCTDEVHIVLNGIVENHAELRRELRADGHVFSSETDAEIVAHLIEKHYDGDLTEAVREPPSPSCAATTPSSPCMPTSPTRWSPPARSAR